MTKTIKRKIIRQAIPFFESLLEGFCEMPTNDRLQAIEYCQAKMQTETDAFMKIVYTVLAERLPELNANLDKSEVSK